MAWLLWMLPLLPSVLPAAAELPKPVDVAVVSTGLSHVVKWRPGAGTPAQASYLVSITTERRASEDVVSGCERVRHRLLCNLTEVFSDPTETYIAAVRATLDQQTSRPAFTSRYTPVDHMAPPLLTLAPCGRDLCVDLQPPLERQRRIYSVLSYVLHVQSSSEEDAQFSVRTSLRTETLQDLRPGRRYCVSVSFWDVLEETRSTSSQPVCAQTPSPYPADSLLAALLCLLALAVAAFAVSGLVLAGFIPPPDAALPSVLASIRHAEEDTLSPRRASVSSLWTLKHCEDNSTPSTPSRPSTPSSCPGRSEEPCAAGGGAPCSGYNQEVGASTFLSSSSSSSSHADSPALATFASRSRLTVDAGGGDDDDDDGEEEEEGGDPGEEGDVQDVNLLSLRLGRFEDLEGLDSPGDECPASSAVLHLGEEEDEDDEEEPQGDSGYMRHPQV